VEIIYALLYKIKLDHPEITAVTSGAIYSSYQKNRVVHVYSFHPAFIPPSFTILHSFD
jgi:diphthamide synthase (EF-2-diphthine--ammonia ligase)